MRMFVLQLELQMNQNINIINISILHIHEKAIFIEIVDLQSYKPVPYGEVGAELCRTHKFRGACAA